MHHSPIPNDIFGHHQRMEREREREMAVEMGRYKSGVNSTDRGGIMRVCAFETSEGEVVSGLTGACS